MHPVVRHTLRVVAILSFFVIAPFLLFYVFGYRLNLDDYRLQRVGLIHIASTPEKASIFLNNKDTEATTPEQLTNLRPQLYQLRIEKEEHLPWKKELYVGSGQVTWVPNIQLFLEQPETELLYEGAITHADATDTGLGAFFSYNKDTNIHRLFWVDRARPTRLESISLTEKEQTRFSTTDPARITLRAFGTPRHPGFIVRGVADDNTPWLFIATEESGTLLDRSTAPEELLATPLTNLFLQTRGKIAVYTQEKTDLSIYTLNEGLLEKERLQEGLQAPIGISDTRIGYTHAEEGTVSTITPNATIFDGDSTTTKTPLTTTLRPTEQFIPSRYQDEQGAYLFLDAQTQSARVQFEKESTSTPFEGAVQNLVFGTRSPMLAYHTPFSVGFIALQEQKEERASEAPSHIPQVPDAFEARQPTTIARFQEPITTISWHPRDTHIATLLKNQIIITEIDGRGSHKQVGWATTYENQAPFLQLTEDGTSLLTITEKGLEYWTITKK